MKKLVILSSFLLAVALSTPHVTQAQDDSSVSRQIVRREEHFPNGKLKARWAEYVNSDGTAVKHGAFENWYDNGQQKSSIEYTDGKEDGVLSVWQNDGKFISITTFRMGRKNGKTKVYNQDGILMSAGNYVLDSADGWWTHYYPNGNIEYRAEFKNNRQDGKWEGFYPDGKPWKFGFCTDGQVDSIWTIYDSLGNVKATETYRMGSLVNSTDSTEVSNARSAKASEQAEIDRRAAQAEEKAKTGEPAQQDSVPK